MGSDLWVLIDTGPERPATILIVSEGGEIDRRLCFTKIHGADDFAVDSRRNRVYFYISDSAELLRVPLDAAS